MLEAEIAEYLDDQDVLTFDESGTSGDTFIGTLPSSPDEAIALYPQGGTNPSPKFIEDEHDIQFLCRGTEDPRGALSTARDIYGELHGLSKTTIGEDEEEDYDGTEIILIQSIQAGPTHIGRDDNGRHMYSLNFRVEYENSTEHRSEK